MLSDRSAASAGWLLQCACNFDCLSGTPLHVIVILNEKKGLCSTGFVLQLQSSTAARNPSYTSAGTQFYSSLVSWCPCTASQGFPAACLLMCAITMHMQSPRVLLCWVNRRDESMCCTDWTAIAQPSGMIRCVDLSLPEFRVMSMVYQWHNVCCY